MTIAELLFERLKEARQEIADCEKLLRTLGVSDVLILDGLVRRPGDSIRYDPPQPVYIPPPKITPKKRGPYHVKMTRKKVKPEQIATNLEKASRETTTRAKSRSNAKWAWSSRAITRKN